MRTSPYTAAPYRVTRTRAAALPFAATVSLAVLLGTAPVQAAPNVYYHAGAWHAFTDKDDQGAAICGIGTENTSDGRNLTLTYTIGGSDLTFTATKQSWNIPANSVLEADMQIDRNEAWQAQASGNGTSLQWVVSASEIRNFDTQFRNGSTMTLTFPSGNEPAWSLALRGSTAASATLWRCVQDLKDRAKAAAPTSSTPTSNTPAANAPAATQPFGQAPSQPYAAPAAQSTAPANGATAPAPTSGATAPTPSTAAPAQPSSPASGTPAQTAAPTANGTPAPATKP